jgi:hypothetical protein
MAAVLDSFVQAKQPFVDGFGQRRLTIDARGDHLDLLCLRESLATTPSFESALRERVARLSGFHHPSYSLVRAVEVERSTGTLAILSDHAPGARLTTLLAAAEKRSVRVDLPAVARIVRQLVLAATAWHEHMPDVVHGAIGPDRLVITPDGRPVIVEYVLGSAIEQLRYSRQQYWEELGIPLPATFKFDINDRADILQVGAVALALLLGRRLGAADHLNEIPPDLQTRLEPSLRAWLSRALQLEPVGSFTSVLDAHAALDSAFGEENPVAEQDVLLLFMARCLALDVDRPPAQGDDEPDTPGRTDDLPDVDLATRIEALRTFLARRSARREAQPGEEPPGDASAMVPPSEVPPTVPAAAVQPTPSPWQRTDIAPSQVNTTSSALAEAPATSTTREEPRRITTALPPDWTRYLWIAAAIVLAIGAALLLLVLGVFPRSSQPSTGALSITTRPAGVAVTIDGTPRGVTPLAIELETGDHVVELVTSSERRQIPVTIRAGGEVSQFLEMGVPAPPTDTELRIRTEPLGAEVTVDGKYIGRSPVSVGDLTPGPHTVVLKLESGTATEQVLIEPGKAASLFVPLAQVPAGAAAGWISVPSPVEVQLFEDGRLLGTSSVDRIMLPAGRHDLDVVNEALGFRQRQTVRVTPGQVATIKIAWPNGSLAINAVPWAEAFVDGRSVGETPIGNVQVPIGTHEILFRHPQLGERTARVTVTTHETAKVGVDLRAR